MHPKQEAIQLLMSCQDQVKVLPPEAEVLATSTCCPIGMFRVGEKMLGIQAHPEFSKAYTRLLVESRVARIGQKEVAQAVQSLEASVDREVISNWISNFVTQE